MNPKLIFLCVFIFFNILAAFLIHKDLSLIGDVASVNFHSWDIVLPTLCFLIASYIVWLAVIYNVLFSIKYRQVISESKLATLDKPVGVFIFIIQVAFISYFVSTGTFSANSTVREGSIFSAFWVLVSVDNLFLIYYSCYRHSKLFKFNLVIAIISNIMRGWSSIFFVILFIEFCRLYRRKRLRMRNLVMSGTLVLVLYPVLYVFKLMMRATVSGGEADAFNLVMTGLGLESGFTLSNYYSLMLISLEQIVVRFQLLSNALAIYEIKDFFNASLEAGRIIPFWFEGIYGLIIHKFLSIDYPLDLGQMLAQYVTPLNVDASWNANPTFLAWFFISPDTSLIYMIYLISLAYISVVLCKALQINGLYKDFVWFSWFSYIIPGWIASFILFVHSQLIFLVIIILFNFIYREISKRERMRNDI
ncbi:oligosaccharide repeat unit polymerase [Aeromonas hydrophila]|uniref:oligosaccharide repeat unit polymerase n=1 Tax=Aeromonas hydrophila TaxID=644 RepID=UPI00259E75DF|nr:oligosaccharide repeat unit polymerase [Aeromonas hydrophila]MDM5119741.1 oligosaccharide repeat unit polymerase [Aeromonas hydrophila]